MRSRTLIATLVILALMLTACGPTDNIGEEPARLDGTSWVLQTMDGEAPLEGTTITAEFAEGEINGTSGCNSYGGSYSVEDGEIAISDLFWTEMACLDPEGIMEQEQRYLSILNNATRLEQEANRLTLRTPDGQGLIFGPSS